MASGMNEQDAYSIDDFCARFGIGRSQTYEELRAGRLHAKKLGRRTLITHEAALNWLRSLPAMPAREKRAYTEVSDRGDS